MGNKIAVLRGKNIMNNIDKMMIIKIYDNIVNKCEFPKFGSPETRCDKCMFHGIACLPLQGYVGCFHGWKREEEK